MASSTEATTSDDAQYKGHVLRLGFDLGTGHVSIDGQHVQGDRSCEPSTLCIQDPHRGTSIKQIAILQHNGNVIYGSENVVEAVRQDSELRDKELERFKLALHPEFAQLDAQEDRGTIQDFFTHFFRKLMDDVRNWYESQFHAGMGARYWKSIPLELEISVPAMWGDDPRGVIRNAAKIAGAARVELREEPLCIATTYMVDLVKDRSVKVGQCLLLIDCGEGTLDIAIVKLDREPSAGQDMELARVGDCSGNGAGSHMVNTAAEKWLLSGSCPKIESLGGFDETCKQLGMSRREFLRGFSDGIDTVKDDIDKRNVFTVMIFNPHEDLRPGILLDLIIPIPRARLLSWYATWISLVKKLLEDHLSARRSEHVVDFVGAFFTGGGAKSSQFRREMKAVLDAYQIPVRAGWTHLSACSKGALLQHVFQEDSLPPDAYFYIAHTEEYDPANHPDAVNDNSLIHQSEYDTSQSVVRDRLRQVMRSPNRHIPTSLDDAPDDGDSSSDNDAADETRLMSEGYIPQTFYVEAGGACPRIHVDIFWSLESLTPHCALHDAQGERLDGVRSYPLVFLDAVDFGERGFTIRQEGNGKPHYLVEGFVLMEVADEDESLCLTVFLMNHDYVFPRKLLEPAPKKERQQRLDDSSE
ncbi:hypothetical protein Q7P36_011316 [Cladosporium allicinum]